MYDVDLDLLADTVAELTGVEERLGMLLDELRGRVAALHGTWSGRSAAAHVVAQAEWEAGFEDMRAALAVMRAAAGTAQDNYAEAATTNQRLWEQVR